MQGFAKELERGLGLPIRPADEPRTCVATGAARAAGNRALLDAYRRS